MKLQCVDLEALLAKTDPVCKKPTTGFPFKNLDTSPHMSKKAFPTVNCSLLHEFLYKCTPTE